MRRRHKLRVQWFWWLFKWLFDIRRRVIWSDVCTGGRNPTSKLGMRKSMGGDFFQEGGGGGGSLNIIIMWGGHISRISQPPLHVIIAQSLNLLFYWSPLICTSIVCRDRSVVIWQSLLFSQLIKNNLSNWCGIKNDKIWEDVGLNT